jgi:hypothetical protein
VGQRDNKEVDYPDSMKTTKFLSEGRENSEFQVGRAEHLLINLPSSYVGLFLPIALKYLD